MKRTLFSAAILAASMMVSAWTAQAQTSTMRVNIPFAFEAGGKAHAAGQYDLQMTAGGNQVLLQRTDVNEGASFLPPPMSNGTYAHIENPHLVFHRHGEQYFLREAHTGQAHTLEWLPSKNEKKLTSPFEVALVYAK